MQVAASPAVEFVRTEDISEEVRAAEREAEMRSEDLAGKPEDIKAKMVDGRMAKILKQKVREPVESCCCRPCRTLRDMAARALPQVLLEQPYIRDPSISVEELIKGKISTVGENINVARFVRFNLGETAKKDAQESSGS
jgi:elongation factor Ts